MITADLQDVEPCAPTQFSNPPLFFAVVPFDHVTRSQRTMSLAGLPAWKEHCGFKRSHSGSQFDEVLFSRDGSESLSRRPAGTEAFCATEWNRALIPAFMSLQSLKLFTFWPSAKCTIEEDEQPIPIFCRCSCSFQTSEDCSLKIAASSRDAMGFICGGAAHEPKVGYGLGTL